MRQETDLVPYTTTRLTGSPLLVLAPHPDDEIFGCGGVLLEAVRQGSTIHVVVITDGDAQGDPEIRREESRRAARCLATPEPEFWGFRDRSLAADQAELIDRIRHSVVTIRPELVLAPSPAELHPDHRAVGLATYHVLRNLPASSERVGPGLAAFEVSAFLRPNALLDLSADWPRIREASAAFASQNVVRPYLEVLEAMAVARRLTLPDSVTHAAGLFVVDGEFIAAHDVRTWASAIGPTAGLERDDPNAVLATSRAGLLNRLFGSGRGTR